MNILQFLREQAKNYDCRVCGTNHNRSEISVVGKREGAYVVRVVCSKCEANVTLLVYVGEKPPALRSGSLGAARAQRPPLSLDDVLDAHDLLGSFDGDAQTLFAPRQKVRSTQAS
ncbi:MAG TPA: hypothetical protein VJQ09_07425 [Candidatus Limnocylindria bacterium]|nr:hypothetical protein [Candidatus Limnocylindria bacterium]